MSKTIGGKFILNLEENEYATFDIEEVENVHGIKKNTSILNSPATNDDDKFCTARVYLNYRDLSKCPIVKLDGTYFPSLLRQADTAAKLRLVNTLFAVDGGREELPTGLNTTSVGWKKIQNVSSSCDQFISQTNRQQVL